MKGELLTMITKIISVHPNMNKGYADNTLNSKKLQLIVKEHVILYLLVP